MIRLSAITVSILTLLACEAPAYNNNGEQTNLLHNPGGTKFPSPVEGWDCYWFRVANQGEGNGGLHCFPTSPPITFACGYTETPCDGESASHPPGCGVPTRSCRAAVVNGRMIDMSCNFIDNVVLCESR